MPSASVSSKRQARANETIGWREHVGLPDLGIHEMAAKIDTGARTSALHAVEHEVFTRDGAHWVRFGAPTGRPGRFRKVEIPIVDEREIKNTGGIPERRLVVRTTLLLGRHRWHIDVSLADREKMEFDLILGRTAIRRRGILVDPGRSFLAGKPVAVDQSARPAPMELKELS